MTFASESSTIDALRALTLAINRGSVQDVRAASSAFARGASSARELRDERGRRFAHAAASRGCEHIARVVINELHCDVNARDDDGYTPLMTACASGATACARALIELGADVNATTTSGASVMHAIVIGATLGGFASDVERCEDALGVVTLEARARVASRCANAGTPLCVAAMRGSSGMVRALLKLGADVSDVMGGNGVGVVALACASGDVASVEILIDAGADVNAGPEGNMTPLHIAAAHMNTETCAATMAKVLLAAGADANKADSSGMKAIHAAAATNRRSVVELLLPVTDPDIGIDWTSDGVIKSVAAQLSAMQDASEARSGDGGTGATRATTTEAFVVKDKDAAEKTRRQGNELFVARDYAGADKAYTESLERDGSCAKTWANRSAARLKLKLYAGAKSDAQNSRTIDPLFIKAWYREGEAALELGQFEDAALACFEGLQVDGDNADLKRLFDAAISRGRAASAAK